MQKAPSILSSIAERNRSIVQSVNKGAGFEVAPAWQNYAWQVGKDLAMAQPNAVRRIGGVDEDEKSVTAIISTFDVDRDGDVVVSRGMQVENYSRNPLVFWGHQSLELPIGRAEDPEGNLCVWIDDTAIRAKCFFDQEDPDAMWVFSKLARGYLNATSIAFVPLQAERRQATEKAHPESHPQGPVGWIFHRADMTEYSFVGIGANQNALRDAIDSEKSFITPKLQKSVIPFCAKARGRSFSGYSPAVDPFCSDGACAAPPAHETKRWNKSLSEAFEVEEAKLPASSTTYDWAAKYLQCEIKNIYQSSTHIPHARMGTFLTGLQMTLQAHQLVDTRNIGGGYERGSESPPVYETIRLNSKSSGAFLIDGQQFWQENAQAGVLRNGPAHRAKSAIKLLGGRKFILNYQPDWSGLDITGYVERQHADLIDKTFDNTWQWAKQNNFLKGEAFALSGEFLPRTEEDWGDIFIEQKNEKVLKRIQQLYNDKGKSFANRGVIFCGPPGTGKTMGGRILRNQCKGTFIWVSSRDFHKSGSVGGIGLAFEMAKELAPTVLFMEDVDNWLDGFTIDFLKTEMDGLSRSKGVLSILTTNFPELLPDALIDRPGRFHDVLNFAHPDGTARTKMLRKWLPDEVPDSEIQGAVARTEGWSGAHVYELAHFARTLQEHDGEPAQAAIKAAMDKIDEQRELITQLQLEGSNYQHGGRRRKELGDDPMPRTKTKSCSKCDPKKPCATCAKKTKSAAKAPAATKTKYITHEGDKWIVHAESGKVLGTHDTREDAVAQLQAIEASKERAGKKIADPLADKVKGFLKQGFTEPQIQRMLKALEESSGAQGGYIVPPSKKKGDEQNQEDIDPTTKAETAPTPEHDEVPDDQTGDENVIDNEDAEDGDMAEEESAVDAPHSAHTLANMHQHMQDLKTYADQETKSMDHPQIKEALQGDEHSGLIEKLQEFYAKLFAEHHPEHKMEDLAAAPPPHQGETETGEAGMVDQGDVPPTEEERSLNDEGNPVEVGDDEADVATAEILDRYRRNGTDKSQAGAKSPKVPAAGVKSPVTTNKPKTKGLENEHVGTSTSLDNEGNPSEMKGMHHCVKAAAHHMDALCTDPAVSMPETHKMMTSCHAKMLHAYHKALDSGGAGEVDPNADAPAESTNHDDQNAGDVAPGRAHPDLTTGGKSASGAVAKKDDAELSPAITQSWEEIKNRLFELTGNRIGNN